MKYKNVFFTFLLVVGLLVVASLAMAEENTSVVTSPPTSVNPTSTEDHDSSGPGELKEHRLGVMKDIQNIKKETDDKRTALTKLKNAVGGTTTGKIVNGTVTAINGGIFTVKNENKIFSVNTDSNTKCVRHFFGTCSLSEIAVNDKVNVYGNFTDDARTTLLAREIRDASIMKVHGTFLGNVISKTDTSFVLESKERGKQTVTFTATTKFTNRMEQPMKYADIQVGNRLRVTGVWDRKNNTVSLVERVKDFSLPVKPSEPAHLPPAATSPSASSGTATTGAPSAASNTGSSTTPADANANH